MKSLTVVSLVLAVLVLALSAGSVHAGGNDCTQFDGNCNSCTSRALLANCGYCGDKAQCLPGTGVGPSGGVHCTGLWSFTSDSCPATPAPTNECQNFDNDCGACMSSQPLGHCGFCSSSSKCFAGNVNGPTNSFCGDGWIFDVSPAMCPVLPPPCSSFDGQCDKCHTALPLGHCGYCGASEKCLSGNDNGPTNGQCSTSSWFWDTTACPTPAPPSPPTPAPSNDCTQFDGQCEACTNNAPNANCGYCSSTMKCQLGQDSGPRSGVCTGTWHWSGDNCPVPVSGCEKFSGDCFGCISVKPQGKCGYCGDNGRCEAGNVNGPTSHFCNGNWTWDTTATCPVVTPIPAADCGQFDSSCGSCVNAPSGQCGYCGTKNTCIKGNVTGAIGAACPSASWYWDAASCPASTPPAANCAAHSSHGCLACTNDPSGQCGFCQSGTNVCEVGNSNGPSSGNCGGSWTWYNSQC